MSTTEHNSDTQHHEDGIGHVIPIKFLACICCILLILTALTVVVSRYDFNGINIAELGIIVAMLIAAVKATLVGLYFMHLRWERPFIGFVFVGSILFVVLFIGMALTDTTEYQPQITKGDTPVVAEAMSELQN